MIDTVADDLSQDAGAPNPDAGAPENTTPVGPDLTGVYCVDPNEGGASQTTYVDSTTGETVTNTGDASTAGDANATGTYIGEADDPNFVSGQGNSAGSSSGSGQTSSSDNFEFEYVDPTKLQLGLCTERAADR